MSNVVLTVPPCLDCGACCERKWTVLVDFDEPVPAMLTEVAPADEVLTPVLAESRSLRMRQRVDGSCVAWNRQTRACSIYPMRPRVCRGFSRGDRLCLGAIAVMRPDLVRPEVRK